MNIVLKVLIADDEPLARSRLRRLLETKCAMDIAILAEAEQGDEVLALVHKYHPDIVFLDIEMPKMNGIEAAEVISAMPTPPAIIFTTAYSEYAIAAVNLQAVGYLVKPVELELLNNVLAKVSKVNRAQKSTQSLTTVSYQLGNKLVRVGVDDISYFYADGKYTALVTKEKVEGLIDRPLKELERSLQDKFIRIHRHALVNLDEIVGIEFKEDNYCAILRSTDKHLPISRRALKAVRAHIA